MNLDDIHNGARVFIDANVLFSAAYKPGSHIGDLWSLKDVELVTSLYAAEEARRNLMARCPDRVGALDGLLSKVSVVPGAVTGALPNGMQLPDKDVPVLPAAVGAGCTHLLTGDARHFGNLYGKTVLGVLIQTPAQNIRRQA